MEAFFEEPELFQARYQRNNKRGGLKNLRCFPTCASFHRERGFCGRMVVLRVNHEPGAKLVVFGEFVPISDKLVGLKLNDSVTKQKALEICRDKTNPIKPWIEGEVVEQAATFTRFAFNRDKKGWHYGWASNKHTCNASHALQAYIMEQKNAEQLVVKGVFQSPQFTLFCRRRRRFAMVPSAPIAPPVSRKRQSNKSDTDVISPSSSRKPRPSKMDDEEDDEGDDDDDEEDDEEEQVKPKKSAKVEAKKMKSASRERKRAISAAAELKQPKKIKLNASKETETKTKPNKTKRKSKKMVVQTNFAPEDVLAEDSHQQKLDMARVEKMLREISRKAIRSKPSLIMTSSNTSSSSSAGTSRSMSPIADLFSSAAPVEGSGEDQQQQLSMNLFDCIDFFTGDSLLDDHLFDGDLLKLENDYLHQSSEVIDELVTFFLEEKSFAEAIAELSRNYQEPSKQTAFYSFNGIISRYLKVFLKKKGMSLEEFDRLFPDEIELPFISGSELMAQNAFQQMLEGEHHSTAIDENPLLAPESSLLSFFDLDLESVTRMNGSWILASSAAVPASSTETTITGGSMEDDGIDTMRESLGYPWILRKMLNFMEEKFNVALEGNVLNVRLQRKLFSSGAMPIILDGDEHDWGMKLPMFEGISGVWKYRAWVNGGVVHHVHDTGGGVNSRMRRRMFVDEEDRLIIEVSLEEFSLETDTWDTVAHAVQRAVRC